MDNAFCMGLFLMIFVLTLPPGHVTNYGLPTLMNVNVLHGHFLLALSATFLECGHLLGVEARKSSAMPQCHVTALEGLLRNGCATKTLLGGRVNSNHLRRQQALNAVGRRDFLHRTKPELDALLFGILRAIAAVPNRIDNLVQEGEGKIVLFRACQRLQACSVD